MCIRDRDPLKDSEVFRNWIINADNPLVGILIGAGVMLAVEAGCDVLLVCHGRDNLQAAYEALLDAVDSGRISQQRLNESVYRILTLKGEFDLNSAWVPAPDVDQLNAQLDELLAAEKEEKKKDSFAKKSQTYTYFVPLLPFSYY